ncbi:ATP-dependent metallopeptidase HflB [Spizellomyces punctatus DAOM BR117]|uniref:ATP-dependent metallopeptidase HflB n=1 Tax=Spizellomyces punctatus (strain DAOM BR117) TaxID=645134 RepID=A0A0L0HWB0_SPIPD|nr:ATP-dependent metallopeptidase HflB [Spizellomyces punctatus DAOM BR117]KND05169.1 ATP-dependent metallopeptidase HflB [Spizellomyces punctatus DAOM BR117]|eukprot:XP_016613208.1 ATP-dependent metallopeptidase HflB [Spizellomyces punctatus DAOM BR117]
MASASLLPGGPLQYILAETTLLINELKTAASAVTASSQSRWTTTEQSQRARDNTYGSTDEGKRQSSQVEVAAADSRGLPSDWNATLFKFTDHAEDLVATATRQLSPEETKELLRELHSKVRSLSPDALVPTLLASAVNLKAESPLSELQLRDALSPNNIRCLSRQLLELESSTSMSMRSRRRKSIPTISSVSSSLPLTGFHRSTARKGLYASMSHSRSHHPASAHTRHFWTERRLQKVEAEADQPEFRADPKKQGELYKELLKSSNHYALMHRYENQPQLGPATSRYPVAARNADIQRIQRDPDCLKAYLSALAKEGNIDKLADKVLAATGTSSINQALGSTPTRSIDMSNSVGDDGAIRQTVGEGREHWVQTNIAEWDRALGRRAGAGAMRGGRGFGGQGMGQPHVDGKMEPIQVIISEAWSWSKFVRKLGSKVLYGLLLMTGLSVLLDQQGIIKSGMATAEVEPNSMQQPIKFADVQGVDEAKHELEEIVAFLKEPKRFMEIGGKLPKGILLYGPPGTGKTHLARAVAGEAGVPFFQMSGSEFDELYVGVGARRVRELFAAAKKKAPCIVFIDEIDAVGSKRSAKDQSYMRQTLNQLLVELDGFSSAEGVIFIAATNTPEALDKALVRPGRFDRLVPVPLPDVKGRAKILQVHMKAVSVSKDVDTHIIARGTPGFSGADLANLINQAAIKASKDGAKNVRMEDLEWAKDKIIMGSERKSAVVTEQNKRLTAYHEGGHTLVALYTQGATPLHKVTVIPRGNALGVTVQLPEADKTNHTKRELHAMLDVCMGGRVAEELIFGSEEVTTGASSDLEKATAVAREMVLVYGMSDKVGVVGYGEEGWEKMSPVTKGIIEAEVKGLLDSAHNRATQLLKTHKEELHRLARALMEHETLNLDEIRTVIKGGEIKPLKSKLLDSTKDVSLGR